MIARRRLVAALAVVACLATSTAGAGSASSPEATDPRGDHGYEFLVPVPGQDQLDLLAVWFSTGYRVEKQRDEGGAVESVRYVPESVRISVRTAAPARPTPGFSSIYYVSFYDLRCSYVFEAYVRGPHSTSAEPAEGVAYGRFCEGDAGIDRQRDDGLSFSVDADVLTMTYPFASLKGPLAGTLRPDMPLPIEGARIYSIAQAHTHQAGFDQMRISFFEPPFVIGSDVPATVECTDSPDHPDCTG